MACMFTFLKFVLVFTCSEISSEVSNIPSNIDTMILCAKDMNSTIHLLSGLPRFEVICEQD